MADHSLSGASVTFTGVFHDLVLKRSHVSVVWGNDPEKRLGLPVPYGCSLDDLQVKAEKAVRELSGITLRLSPSKCRREKVDAPRPGGRKAPTPLRCAGFSFDCGRLPGWRTDGSERIFRQLATGFPKHVRRPMSKADDLRKEAKEAGKRGDKTKSLKEGAREHKREKALNDMADNEDWLEGKPKSKAPK